ncbi:hypothetical protein BDV26DRAFT_150119 [Aspergillus bertholletiae]|uniref:Uncharacterized protein n=1 Tax=Aspergillus bertholletiae TaxID=1226010 RepID=A0A5N7BE29_9EURO|nr:hypothetical protein BDV26DRAFT_150119 [Aspergillus bertholletiae]
MHGGRDYISRWTVPACHFGFSPAGGYPPRLDPRGAQAHPCIDVRYNLVRCHGRQPALVPWMDPFERLVWVHTCGVPFSIFFLLVSRVFLLFQILVVCQVPTVGDHCRRDACSKSYINPRSPPSSIDSSFSTIHILLFTLFRHISVCPFFRDRISSFFLTPSKKQKVPPLRL